MKIRKLTHAAIAPYGRIIDRSFLKDDGSGDKYGVLLKERSAGWRIGYLILRKRAMYRLEQHPDSLETFEPVKGRAVIAFAAKGRPDDIKLFFLDKPVVIKKGVWHEVFAISGECELKIFENDEVKTKYHYLKKPVTT
jgi:ureidoglycolate hydrolase